MEVEDGLRDDLETLRRCTIEGNVEGAKQVVFECEKMFKLSFIDQRVNYHMSAMRKDEFSTALIPREVELRSCIALKTTGNANCMFNAASLLLAENESLSDVIRLLIAGVLFLKILHTNYSRQVLGSRKRDPQFRGHCLLNYPNRGRWERYDKLKKSPQRYSRRSMRYMPYKQLEWDGSNDGLVHCLKTANIQDWLSVTYWQFCWGLFKDV